MRKHQGFYWS